MQTKIKAGQSWKSRSGAVFVIMNFSGTKEHPFIGMNDKMVLQRFTENGRYHDDTVKHELDLIELL